MPAFLLPDLGEGLTEAEIVAWHVQAGDTVTVDQSVAEVETAKALVEVPVPFAGRVTELHGHVGDVVAVGAPLITVDADGSGNVLIGYGTSGGRARRRGRVRPPAGPGTMGRAPQAPALAPGPAPAWTPEPGSSPGPGAGRPAPGRRRVAADQAARPERRAGPGGRARLRPGWPDHPARR